MSNYVTWLDVSAGAKNYFYEYPMTNKMKASVIYRNKIAGISAVLRFLKSMVKKVPNASDSLEAVGIEFSLIPEMTGRQ